MTLGGGRASCALGCAIVVAKARILVSVALWPGLLLRSVSCSSVYPGASLGCLWSEQGNRCVAAAGGVVEDQETVYVPESVCKSARRSEDPGVFR